MMYLGMSDGVKGFLFMRSNTALFVGTQATFDEALFPCCPDSTRRQHVPVGENFPLRDDDPADPQDPPQESGDMPSDDDEDFPPPPPAAPAPPFPPQRGPDDDDDDQNPTSDAEKRVPGPSSQPPSRADTREHLGEDEAHMAKLCWEGGQELITELLSKAVPVDDDALPDTSKIRDWMFKDILKLPSAQQREWMNACCEELEALRQ
ncbi:hypothetical protein GGF50DRAFT_17748, partial [Schizophyllum commune]